MHENESIVNNKWIRKLYNTDQKEIILLDRVTCD